MKISNERKIAIFKLLKEEIETDDGFTGMCMTISCLKYLDRGVNISNYDHDWLRDYVEKNKPFIWFWKSEGGYWWEIGVKEPRLKWIDKQILKIKNE